MRALVQTRIPSPGRGAKADVWWDWVQRQRHAWFEDVRANGWDVKHCQATRLLEVRSKPGAMVRLHSWMFGPTGPVYRPTPQRSVLALATSYKDWSWKRVDHFETDAVGMGPMGAWGPYDRVALRVLDDTDALPCIAIAYTVVRS